MCVCLLNGYCLSSWFRFGKYFLTKALTTTSLIFLVKNLTLKCVGNNYYGKKNNRAQSLLQVEHFIINKMM